MLLLIPNNWNHWFSKNQIFNNSLILNFLSERQPLTNIKGLKQISKFAPFSISLQHIITYSFNPTTIIKSDNTKRSFAMLVTYISLIKYVKTFFNEKMNIGSNRADWNTSEYPGRENYHKL